MGFSTRKLSPEERFEYVKKWAQLTDEEARLVHDAGALKFENANRMTENAIGTLPIPLGVAANFLIDGKDRLIPMAIEEPSVVAAASNGARMARVRGGFTTGTTTPLMLGQIQVVNVKDPAKTRDAILGKKKQILDKANEQDPILNQFGGGAKDLDALSRKVVAGHGYGEYFNHQLGHGIGLQFHEPPTLHPASEDVLEEGMVFAVEPGIYIPGWGGVRIEENLVVTGNGCRSLCPFPQWTQG